MNNHSPKIAHKREHASWRSMRYRCTNPKYPGYTLYGGRGIKIDPRWQDFSAFLADMGPRPEGTTLDRIDPDSDYGPGLCRWATYLKQSNNRRDNWLLTAEVDGKPETKTVGEWARQAGLRYHTLWRRLCRGWAVAAALSMPSGTHLRNPEHKAAQARYGTPEYFALPEVDRVRLVCPALSRRTT